MNTIVTKSVYGEAKRILKTHSIESASFLTDLSETTLRRIKKSTSLQNYKELMKLDNPNRTRNASSKKRSKKVPVKSLSQGPSSHRVRRVPATKPEQKPVKKSWRQRIFG